MGQRTPDAIRGPTDTHIILPVNLSFMVHRRLLPMTVPTFTRSRCQHRPPGPDIPSSRCPPPLSLILDASPTVGSRPVQSKHICTSPIATGAGTDAIPKPRLVAHSRPPRLPLPLSLPMLLSESPVLVHLSHPTATQPSRSSKEPTTCNSG